MWQWILYDSAAEADPGKHPIPYMQHPNTFFGSSGAAVVAAAVASAGAIAVTMIDFITACNISHRIKAPRQYHADHADSPHCHGHPSRYACPCDYGRHG